MTYKWLKWTRVIIALVFFLLTLLVFLDFRDIISEKGVNRVLYLQFIPSLLKFLVLISLSAVGFILVLVLTALFGRVYCSAVCPLGILQDFISRGGRMFKKKRKRRYKYTKPKTILRYTILITTVLLGLFGSVFIVNILDPYSMFGKVATGLLRPVGIWINNDLAHILESMNVFLLSLKDIGTVHLATLAFPVIILFVLIYMAGRYGRLYCNTICPVGTLLGWISRFSLFRIEIDAASCIKCGKCAFSCKSGCISIVDLSVDHSRCVACYDCLPTCDDDAIRYSFKRKPRSGTPTMVKAEVTGTGRKKFIFTSIVALSSLAGIKHLEAAANSEDEPLNKKPTTVPVKKTSPVSPPGSLSVDHFNSICTACQLCVSQCPTGVLQPARLEYGLLGYMQPFMDYSSNYCNFECTRCSDVCPTGAILQVTKENKKTLQMGKVTFIKENCVVYTENTACGSCSEHCPTQAVTMVPYKGSLTIPETDNSICVGCGACEHACPVRPYKAIFVDGNPIHQIAEKPKAEKLETPDTEEDFPF